MALTGEPKKEEGKDTYIVKFTNGTFEQLKELSVFLNKEGILNSTEPVDVVKIAISFLQAAKENKENKT